MELCEPIETINQQLLDTFGIDTVTGDQIWRVVWSQDQFEKRLGTYDDISSAGIFLRQVTEVREVPKYRQWITEKYVLERLVVIPDMNLPELPTTKVSYEPIYVFEDGNGDYLPPKFIVAKFVIDTIYAAQYGPKNHSLSKYIDKENSQEAEIANRKKEVDGIVEYLWGDQSSFSDGIKSKETVHISNDKFLVKES